MIVGRPIVRKADMDEDMQQDAMKWAVEALEKRMTEKVSEL